MTSRVSVLALLGLAACSFPSEGVPLGDDVPDAETTPDACVPLAESCDGVDNDCDGNFDEGFASGAACDGPDEDLCQDDMMVCGDGGGEICGDTSGDDNLELCNGPDLDEDCDGMTDEGYALVACDGADSDVCSEGTATCAPDGLGVVCGDVSGDTVELCDDIDQDCDGSDTNGFDLAGDEANCGECGFSCSNANGTTTCVTGTCMPVCNSGSALCNDNPNDGCELQDTVEACSATPEPSPSVLAVDGDDTPLETASTTGITDRFVRIRFREEPVANQDIDITGSITLVSGAGTDFDLFVYCTSGTHPLSTATLCATSARSEGDDAIDVGRDDANGDRGFEVIAEVRYKSGSVSTTCNPWTLTITGNTGTTNRCANPP